MSTQRRSTTATRGSNTATALDAGRERVPGITGLTTPALLLFASGIAALVYQVLWIKQLSLVVGVDVYAVTTGVSAFFAGLALGGTLLGRWPDRLARPLLLYALLELGVAVLGVAATLARAPLPFAVLEDRAGPLAWALLFALVGGFALSYEVVWSQAIVPFMSTRSFAFAVVLATYLAGLVIGSALYARWADRIRDPWGVFGLLIAAAGLVALLELGGSCGRVR